MSDLEALLAVLKAQNVMQRKADEVVSLARQLERAREELDKVAERLSEIKRAKWEAYDTIRAKESALKEAQDAHIVATDEYLELRSQLPPPKDPYEGCCCQNDNYC